MSPSAFWNTRERGSGKEKSVHANCGFLHACFTFRLANSPRRAFFAALFVVDTLAFAAQESPRDLNSYSLILRCPSMQYVESAERRIWFQPISMVPSCDHASRYSADVRSTDMCNGKTRRPRRSCCSGCWSRWHMCRRVSILALRSTRFIRPGGRRSSHLVCLVSGFKYGQLVPVNLPGGYCFHGPAMFRGKVDGVMNDMASFVVL
jgi:hypothetical protein